MKLYIKLRNKGEVCEITQSVFEEDKGHHFVEIGGTQVWFTLGVDCDLCDELGRLLVPDVDIKDKQPDLETVMESGRKFAKEHGGGEYGFALKCYKSGAIWAIKHMTQTK